MPDLPTLRGQLLVASPALVDPNFVRSVVLVTEHSQEGAMGLVLNRPAEVVVADTVPQLAELVDDDACLHLGGPVQREAVMALAEVGDPSVLAAVTLENVGFLPAEVDSSTLASLVRRARVFAGYAGWGAGQLEAELEESAWIVEPAHADDVFTGDPPGLWSAVLRRKGGNYAVLSLMPPDPSLN